MVNIIRATMAKYILENPITISMDIRPMIDNGYGVNIPDLSQVAVTTVLGVARVSRRKLPDPFVTGSRTPYDHQDAYYLLAEYTETWLNKGIVFAYFNQKYRTGLVEDRIIGGQIVYKLCALELVTSADLGDYYGPR